MIIAVDTVTITYEGLIIAVGRNLPSIMSRITPPATPVIVESTMTPTMSALCSTALNAPVKANAIVPNRSRIWTKNGDTWNNTSDGDNKIESA